MTAREQQLGLAYGRLSGKYRTAAELQVDHRLLRTLVARGKAECTNGALRPESPAYGYRLAGTGLARALRKQAAVAGPRITVEGYTGSRIVPFNGPLRLTVGDVQVTLTLDEDDLLWVQGGQTNSSKPEGLFVLSVDLKGVAK